MTGTPSPNVLELLAGLEAMRGNRALLYYGPIADDALPVLYECLKKAGHIERLDLVLSTTGGSVTAARQIALLVREYASHLTVLVPYRARSAGTLLCLAADEVILGPLAELGPVDSNMGSEGELPPGAPGIVSAEDVRAFRLMAEDWFGVERPEDRLQILALVSQRFFPTSLSSFYRFDKLVRQIAGELLEYQFPGAEKEEQRKEIANQLVGGYHAHDYALSRREVRELGLKARDASPEEEDLLWSLSKACRTLVTGQPGEKAVSAPEVKVEGEVLGLVAASDFYARNVLRRHDPLPPGREGCEENGSRSDKVEVGWEIED